MIAKKTSMRNLDPQGRTGFKLHIAQRPTTHVYGGANGTSASGKNSAPDTLHIDVFPSQGFLG